MSRKSVYLDRIEELEVQIMDAEKRGDFDEISKLEKELCKLEEKLCH